MSSGTLFYSWQADLPNAGNRSLIQTALERAAKTLVKDEALRVEPVIDRDTANVPGAPDITATIFEKIEAAQVFVADVSIINAGSAGRPTPNPNVLVELGYALRCLGPSRLLMVFNTAYGIPEDLPFDLRAKRVLSYNVPAVRKDKAAPRAGLARAFEVALRTIFETLEVEADEDTPPPLPITEETLMAYITSNRRLRRLDQELAQMFQVPLNTEARLGGLLADQFKCFGIELLPQLDAVLKKHGEIALLMGRSWHPGKQVYAGLILSYVAEVLTVQLENEEDIERCKRAIHIFSDHHWEELRQRYEQAALEVQGNRQKKSKI